MLETARTVDKRGKVIKEKRSGIPVQQVMIIFLCLRFYLSFLFPKITKRRAVAGSRMCAPVSVSLHTHLKSFHWLLILVSHLTQLEENLQLLAFNIINISNVIKSIAKMYIQWFYEAQDLLMYFQGNSRVLCSVHCWTMVENPGAHA